MAKVNPVKFDIGEAPTPDETVLNELMSIGGEAKLVEALQDWQA